MRHLWWVLFGALLLQLLFNPCMRSDFESHAVIYVVLNTLVVGAIIARFWGSLLGILLSLPLLALYWVPFVAQDLLTLSILTGLLYLFAIVRGFHLLMRVRDIGLSELAGACSLYLLIGLTWAYLYIVIEAIHPGSFRSVEPLDLGSFVYYSFTTLTTLGYGDIAPVSCQARTLATLEAVSGLFCLSFVVARLISLHTARVLSSQK